MPSDFVDSAVDGWAKQYPGLETSALEITGRLDRIARLLDRKVTSALTESGVSRRDLDVLGALRRAGPPFGLPASELARAAMVTSGGMTGQADRLASAGLVERRPDAEDRRAVVVTLTPEGTDVVEQALRGYLGASEEVLGVLNDKERRTLAALLRKLLLGLEGEVESFDLPPSAKSSPAAATGRNSTQPHGGPRTRHADSKKQNRISRTRFGRPTGRPSSRRKPGPSPT